MAGSSCENRVFTSVPEGFFKKKISILTWGEQFKFFFKRTLPLIYFSLWQKFCLDSPKICLWSWKFFLFIWTQNKMFFIWENNSWKSFWICTMAFGKSLTTFNFPFLPWHLCKSSPNPSLTFGSCFTPNPASWTSPCIYFHSNSIQINFCLLF